MPHARRRRHGLIASLAVLAFVSHIATAIADTTMVSWTNCEGKSDVRVVQDNDSLTATWPIDASHNGVLKLSLDTTKPLIAALATQTGDQPPRPILQNVDPCGVLTVGTRNLKPAGWIIFFDNPGKRPWKAYPLKIGRAKARVLTENGRTAIALDGASAGPFEGEIRFTFYPGGRLVRAAAILSTQRESSAILFDTGLVAQPESPAPWQSIAWTDLSDKVARMPAGEVAGQNEQQIKVRHRTIIAEGEAGGSVAIVPPPHQYFYPLDSVDNLASTWAGRNYRQLIDGPAFGVRQTVEGDRRWVPWMNAPPGTKQDLGVFYLLSDGDASAATNEALAYTHNDTFVPLDGYKTFSSHYHVEHAVDFLNQQKAQGTAGIPKGLETPPFVKRFRDVGLNIAHLAEFHLGDGDMKVADRLTRLKTLHDECARLSDSNFLMLPGEEPNVHLGGHWLSFFPKPVYWTLDRKKDQPFVEQGAKYGTVYHVGSPADVLKLMETENGLMWTAHPRIKASTNYPDVYKDEPFFKSDHFLGGAWKAMPADCSLPRLGTRVLDLFDDMNNWGAHKQAPGEVDVFKIDADSELYAHMNINYLKLTELPSFASGWQPVLDTLRAGQFFTTTGEVLIPTFTIDGQSSGGTISPPTGPSRLRATVRWTFPLAFAEVVSGDGPKTYRQRIDLADTRAFGTRDLDVEADLRGKTWARFEVWDIAANGAYTQPVWIK